MNYVTSFERIGVEKGIQQGVQLGEGALLMLQLEHKFKTIPEQYHKQIEQASPDNLMKWGKRVLDKDRLEEIFLP